MKHEPPTPYHPFPPKGKKPKMPDQNFTGFELKIITLPNHIMYYYKVPIDVPFASSFALNVELLSIRLTGRFLAEVDDPDGVIPLTERRNEVNSPCVGRGGHPKLKTTITATVDRSSTICLYPKDEIYKIVGPDRAAKIIALPPYTILKNERVI